MILFRYALLITGATLFGAGIGCSSGQAFCGAVIGFGVSLVITAIAEAVRNTP